jgi:cell division protease FtsH
MNPIMGYKKNPYKNPFIPYWMKYQPSLPSKVEGGPSIIILVNEAREDDGIETPLQGKMREKHQAYLESIRNAPVSRVSKSENFEIQKNISFRFSQIGGYENVKAQLYQIIDMYQNQTKYKKHGARIPKGILLEGPPGNGKTLLARAMAGECGMNFLAVSGSQFQEMYVGVGAARIRELFKLANNNKPCIIFLDEIDALGKKRSDSRSGADSERDSTYNELLVQMDGFQDSDGIFLMMATNRADMLDPALLRPGRTDKRITIHLPDVATRREILRIHSKNKAFESDVEEEKMVEDTAGCSGAEIENYLNEAILHALLQNRTQISISDLEMALDSIQHGYLVEKSEFSLVMKERIAVHELGHAWLGLNTTFYDNLHSIRINLHNVKNPAYTKFESKNVDKGIQTREYLMEQLMILLGGRIAEQLFYGIGSFSTGAQTDLNMAEQLTRYMVYDCGMTMLPNELMLPHSIGEHAKKRLDKQQHALIEYAYKEGKKRMKSGGLEFIQYFIPILLERGKLNASEMSGVTNYKDSVPLLNNIK